MRVSRKVPQALVTVIVLAATLIVAACGTTQGGERTRAPNYASPVGTNNWEVNCGRDKIIVDDTALDDFYNADGSAKTYVEFCQEAEPSLINRSR